MRFHSIEKYLNVPVFFNFHNGELQTFCNKYSKVVILTDENTVLHCYPKLCKVFQGKFDFELITIAAGEEEKSIETVSAIIDKLLHAVVPKNALLLAVGGGVLCDIVGFTASVYKRGVNFAYIPTTLLAMVDASIGGKTGVNHLHQKNMIGVINQPSAIFINESYLDTLTELEIKNGFAESLKHALIADHHLFEKITLENCHNILMIHQSANIKMRFVEEDEHEKNIRKALNFGHTIGHAIETYSHEIEKPLSHGYAVAFGMFCEAYISLQKGMLSEKEFVSIAEKIKAVFEGYEISEEAIDMLISHMRNDKKNDAQIRFCLLKGIGNYSVDEAVDELFIKDAILHFINHYK
jgi:3-dehydroquinate synthase